MFPLAADRTIVECDWLYLPEVVASGRDLDESVELFDRVNQQDFEACELCQPATDSGCTPTAGCWCPASTTSPTFQTGSSSGWVRRSRRPERSSRVARGEGRAERHRRRGGVGRRGRPVPCRWHPVRRSRGADPGAARAQRSDRGQRGGRRARCAQVDRLPVAERAGEPRTRGAGQRSRQVRRRRRSAATGQHGQCPAEHRAARPAGAGTAGRRVRRDGQPRRLPLGAGGQRRSGHGPVAPDDVRLDRQRHALARHRQRQDHAGRDVARRALPRAGSTPAAAEHRRHRDQSSRAGRASSGRSPIVGWPAPAASWSRD